MYQAINVQVRDYYDYLTLLGGLFHLSEREKDVMVCLHKYAQNFLITKRTRRKSEEEMGININNYVSKLKQRGLLIRNEDTGLYSIAAIARMPEGLKGVNFNFTQHG